VTLLFKIRRSFLYNLTLAERRRGVWIAAILVINAALDFFSLAAFVPLVVLIVDPKTLEQPGLFRVLTSYTNWDHSTILLVTTGSILLFIIIKNLIAVRIATTKARYAFSIRSRLATAALAQVIHSDYQNMISESLSAHLHRVSNHPLAFANNIIISSTTIVAEAFVVIFLAAFMFYYDALAIVSMTLLLAPLLILFFLRRGTLGTINASLKTTYPTLLNITSRILDGYLEIRTYLKMDHFLSRFRKTSDSVSEIFIKDHVFQAGTQRLTEILVTFLVCVLVCYSVLTGLTYQKTVMLIGIFSIAMMRIVPSLNRIQNSLQQIKTNEYILDDFFVETTGRKPQHLTTNFNREFSLRQITFAHTASAQPKLETSFTFRPGEMIALTGSSGAGKTSLLMLIAGILKPKSGAIVVDGAPTKEYVPGGKLLRLVPQQPYLFNGTIAENIAFGEPDETIAVTRINELLSVMQLSEWVLTLSDGINTRIGDRAAKISGGQAQRLAITRALYADPQILLLDEITNQVPAKVENQILQHLRGLADRGKTVIIATHKNAYPEIFDRTINLSNGSLTESNIVARQTKSH
jgi:ABC-type multidrug transport system fused ATPase/permease subunit